MSISRRLRSSLSWFRSWVRAAGLCVGLIGVPCGLAADTSPVRVLIVDGYSNHAWKLTTLLIRQILEPTDKFVIDVSTAPADPADRVGWQNWKPDFAAYDVVIQTCNNIRGGPSWPDHIKVELETFVRNGGGLYVFHSANNAFADWPEYDRMIGLGWRKKDQGVALAYTRDGHPVRFARGEGRNTNHGPRRDAMVKLWNRSPIQEGFPASWLTPELEIYRYVRGVAEDVDVIASAWDDESQLYWPIAWLVCYGRGRVFNATYGHIGRQEQDQTIAGLECVAVQTTMIRAVQWLARRAVDWPVPSNFPTSVSVALNPLYP